MHIYIITINTIIIISIVIVIEIIVIIIIVSFSSFFVVHRYQIVIITVNIVHNLSVFSGRYLCSTIVSKAVVVKLNSSAVLSVTDMR